MLNANITTLSNRLRVQRGLLFGLLIVGALLAFELFNYSTTDFALTDLLGDLKFMGVSWATILSVAFCGIDFAGIARLFTPEQGRDEPMEVCLWSLDASCYDECHADLVGGFDRITQPPKPWNCCG